MTSRRTGAFHARKAIADAINPGQQVILEGFKSYSDALDMFKRAARQGAACDDKPVPVPVAINFSDSFRKTAAMRAFSAAANGYSINLHQPRWLIAGYDLVAVLPFEHDIVMRGKKLISVDALPTSVNNTTLNQARNIWSPLLRRSGKRLVSILIGGDVPGLYKYSYTPIEAASVVAAAQKLKQNPELDLVMTTSRRTSPDTVGYLTQNLAPLCLHSYFPDQSGKSSKGQNPIDGYLACPDLIIAPADSSSILSQAVDTAITVQVLRPPNQLSGDEYTFYQGLMDKGHIQPFGSPETYLPRGPIRAAEKIAAAAFKGMQQKYPNWQMVL